MSAAMQSPLFTGTAASQAQGRALPASPLFVWHPNRPFSRMFPAGFEAFVADNKVDGLARVTGDRLEISIVVSTNDQALRQFIERAKVTYGEVAVWGFESHCQRNLFMGQDFAPAQEPDCITGEPREGLQWSRAHARQIDLLRTRQPYVYGARKPMHRAA